MKFFIFFSFIFFSFIFFAFQESWATASIPGLSTAYYSHIMEMRELMSQKNFWSESVPAACYAQIPKISSDGEIKITLAFGYMDVSTGQEAAYTADSYYQIGHVLDRDAKEGMEYALSARCIDKNQFACGFRKSGRYYTKQIQDRWSGRRKTVKIELIAPSVSVVNADNAGPLLRDQTGSSLDAERRFFSAFATSDVVLYLGHARSGGGPDFSPPVLNANGSVNYSHYKKNRLGFRKLLGAVAQGQTPVVGLLACKSTDLFSRDVKRQSPGSLIISADDLFDYNDILPTAYGIIEAVVGQRCGATFEDIVRVVPSSANDLSLFF
jgi:hypothetical protein